MLHNLKIIAAYIAIMQAGNGPINDGIRIYSARLCIMTLPLGRHRLYAREDSEVVDILPTSARHRQCRPMMPITADLLPTSARRVVLSGLLMGSEHSYTSWSNPYECRTLIIVSFEI